MQYYQKPEIKELLLIPPQLYILLLFPVLVAFKCTINK